MNLLIKNSILIYPRRFREYIIHMNKVTEEMSPALKKLLEAKNDGTRIEYKKDLICVYFKDRLEFGVDEMYFNIPLILL